MNVTKTRKDRADLHVERWHDHWVLEEEFDEGVEAMTVRLHDIVRWFDATTKRAASEVGLQDYEYFTLHVLMIRDTPGQASPSVLAEDLGISNAGMTGRLDSLERSGWLQRSSDAEDRRRVHVEVTKAGTDIWRRAMRLRGRAEDELFGVLTPEERHTLAALLKELTLRTEEEDPRS